jgi:predicted P-loop ATPase
MIPPMKLTMSLNQDNTWNKIVTYISDRSVLFEELNLFLSPSDMNKEYFDQWETQVRAFPNVNIIEVERFI